MTREGAAYWGGSAAQLVVTYEGDPPPPTTVAAENYIPGTLDTPPSLPLYLNDPDMYYPAAVGGLCWASANAGVFAYWDRNAYNGVTYWNLIDNGTAPLREPAPPADPGQGQADVKSVVAWLAHQYYGLGREDEAAILTEFANGINGLSFDINYRGPGVTISEKTALLNTIKTEIDAGRPLTAGSWGLWFGGAHQAPVMGYKEMSNIADSMIYIHRNLGGTQSEYVNFYASSWGELDMNTMVPGGDPGIDPESAAALSAAGTYDGYLYGERAFGAGPLPALLGTINVKLKNIGGKLTAKATVQSGSISFRGKEWTAQDGDGTLISGMEGRGGERLDLYVRQSRIWGTLTGGKLGAETLRIEGARNRFADRKDAVAQAALERYKGYYTACLYAVESGTAQGPLRAAPQGCGYLTLTVSSRGKAKIAGILADGTKVAQRSQLLWFADYGEEVCVPFFVPLYRKTGRVGGLIWIDPGNGEVYTASSENWFARWEKPGSGPDGFSQLAELYGGAYARPPVLSGIYLFDAYLDFAGCAYHYAGGAAACLFEPVEVPVEAAGSRLKITRGERPVKISEGGATRYEYGGVNPNMASLSFSSRTGIFKGKYTLYYDFYDAGGRFQHKSVKVPYVGVMLASPATGRLREGYGHSLFPTKDPELRAYRVKPSYPVTLFAQ